MHHPAVLELLSRCGGPTGLRKAGRRKLTSIAAAHAPRMGDRLVEQIMTALDEQTVTVPGTTAAETILPRLADSLRDVLRQRDQVAGEVERMLDAHPLAPVLTSMPGIGVRTAARILLEVGDGSAFPTPGHLAAYAGLAPVTRRSGTCIRGEHPPTRRQQAAQTRVLPRRVRRPGRPRQPGLLRPQTRRRQTPQRRPHLPRPPPLSTSCYAMLRDKIPYQPRPANTPSPLDKTHRDTPPGEDRPDHFNAVAPARNASPDGRAFPGQHLPPDDHFPARPIPAPPPRPAGPAGT